MKAAATNTRNFRTFLLMSQLAAKEIGARIALARNETGMTQDEVAEVATFSKRSLQDYEAGNTIPWRHMQEISGLFRRPVEWFLHGEGPAAGPEVDRLAEVVGAVDALRRQLEDAASAVEQRLEEIERRLPGPNASDHPTGTGTPASGSRV